MQSHVGSSPGAVPTISGNVKVYNVPRKHRVVSNLVLVRVREGGEAVRVGREVIMTVVSTKVPPHTHSPKAKVIKLPVSQTVLGFSTMWAGGYFIYYLQ